MRIKETILTDLRHAIARGEYKPGERLKERDLCSHFKVSRTPIREALNELGKEGLVTITPNAGARVIKFSYEDVADIHDVLIALESTAARLACSKISEEQIRKLEECQFRTARAAGQGNLDLVFELIIQFHHLVTESTGNSYLIEMRKNFGNLVDMFARLFPEGQLQATLEEHPRIIDALRKRNPALAEFEMREHLEHGKKFIVDYFKQNSQDPEV